MKCLFPLLPLCLLPIGAASSNLEVVAARHLEQLHQSLLGYEEACYKFLHTDLGQCLQMPAGEKRGCVEGFLRVSRNIIKMQREFFIQGAVFHSKSQARLFPGREHLANYIYIRYTCLGEYMDQVLEALRKFIDKEAQGFELDQLVDLYILCDESRILTGWNAKLALGESDRLFGPVSGGTYLVQEPLEGCIYNLLRTYFSLAKFDMIVANLIRMRAFLPEHCLRRYISLVARLLERATVHYRAYNGSLDKFQVLITDKAAFSDQELAVLGRSVAIDLGCVFYRELRVVPVATYAALRETFPDASFPPNGHVQELLSQLAPLECLITFRNIASVVQDERRRRFEGRRDFAELVRQVTVDLETRPSMDVVLYLASRSLHNAITEYFSRPQVNFVEEEGWYPSIESVKTIVASEKVSDWISSFDSLLPLMEFLYLGYDLYSRIESTPEQLFVFDRVRMLGVHVFDREEALYKVWVAISDLQSEDQVLDAGLVHIITPLVERVTRSIDRLELLFTTSLKAYSPGRSRPLFQWPALGKRARHVNLLTESQSPPRTTEQNTTKKAKYDAKSN